jgi:hypothetical protein
LFDCACARRGRADTIQLSAFGARRAKLCHTAPPLVQERAFGRIIAAGPP